MFLMDDCKFVEKKYFKTFMDIMIYLLISIPSVIFIVSVLSDYNAKMSTREMLLVFLIPVIIILITIFGIISSIVEVYNAKLVLCKDYFIYTDWRKKEFKVRYSDVEDYELWIRRGVKKFNIYTYDGNLSISANIFNVDELESRISEEFDF